MIEYLNKRERKIFVVCITTVIIYVAYYLIFRPLYRYRMQLEGEIAAAQTKIYKDLRVIRKAELIKEKNVQFMASYIQTVSDDQVMPTLIQRVQYAATRLKISILDLKPQKVRREGSMNTFSVAVEIFSDFKTLVRFLHLLQDEKNLFQLNELSINVQLKGKRDSFRTQLILSRNFIVK